MKNAPLYDQYCSSFTPKLLKKSIRKLFNLKKKFLTVLGIEVFSRKLNSGAIKSDTKQLLNINPFLFAGVIVGGEKWVYGQCYFTFGESFQSGGAFIGEMAGTNVWDRALSSQEISEISRSCAAKKGNIITMSDLNVKGRLRKILFSC